MKRVACFLDGTWNNDDKGSVVTNVVKLYRSVADRDANEILQLSYYVTGIDSAKGMESQFLKGAIGLGVGHRIQEGYQFLVDSYDQGDEIYLFGFSRGAYEARSVAGLIALTGIGQTRSSFPDGKAWLDRAWSIYQQSPSKREPAELERLRAAAYYPVRIKCIGVWDTVGNIGVSDRIFDRGVRVHDIDLHPNVDVALHALSIDEVRGPFRPSLWTLPEGRAVPPGQHVEQVWFAGSHADVGGGFSETGLSDVALDWMMRRVNTTTGLAFDLERLNQWLRDRVSCATKVRIEEIPKSPPIRPMPLGIQHSSADTALFFLSYLFPYIRLIKQNAAAVPAWRRRVFGSFRSAKLPKGQVSINETIHDSVAQRYGRNVNELLTNRSRIITYQPRNLAPLIPADFAPAITQPVPAPTSPAAPGHMPRVKIFTVHGTFAHEADWDDWDEDDEFTAKTFPPGKGQLSHPAGQGQMLGFMPMKTKAADDGDNERNFVNRLSEHLYKEHGVIFGPDDHTEYNWTGGNSHDERRTAALGLKKVIQEELRDKRDLYDGGIFVIGHSHGGTVARLAMNLWDKDFNHYPPIRKPEELTKHDGFKLDDDCPHCMQQRNGRVGPSEVERPDAIVTLGSPFVTFEERKSGLLAAKIGVWVYRVLALIPLAMLLFKLQPTKTGGPLEALASLLDKLPILGGPSIQIATLLIGPLAGYWLFVSYISKRLLQGIRKRSEIRGEGINRRYVMAQTISRLVSLVALGLLVYYYVTYIHILRSPGRDGAGLTALTQVFPILNNPTFQSALALLIPLSLYWLLAISLPARFLAWVDREVIQLKEGLPKKYDPLEDRPMRYASYTTPGDEPGVGLRIFGLNTWIIQTLSLSAAYVLAVGLVLIFFVGIEVLNHSASGSSVIGRLGISALDDSRAHQENLISLMNWLIAFPNAVWSPVALLAGQKPLDALAANDVAVVKFLPIAIVLSVAVTFLVTIVSVLPVLVVLYILNNRLRGSGIVFGSEHFTWTLANRIAVAHRANSNTMIRSINITPEAWLKGKIAHCYYYDSDRVTKDIAAYIAGKIEHAPDRPWPIENWISSVLRWLVVALFVLTIFSVSVQLAKNMQRNLADKPARDAHSSAGRKPGPPAPAQPEPAPAR